MAYPSDRSVDPLERLKFWDSMRDWFEERGYFLYNLKDEGDEKYAYAVPTREYPNEPNVQFSKTVEDPFPYAFMGPSDIRKTSNYMGRPPYTTTDPLNGRVMYAQDIKGRHVAIKMMKGDSEEYKVVRLLKDQPRLLDADLFPSVVPVLDLLPYNDQWFLIMPRWERSLHLRFFPTFQSAFQHLICLLEVLVSCSILNSAPNWVHLFQGLVFLHEHRIFHKDIFERNLIVNHFSSLPPACLQLNVFRYFLKIDGSLRYAIMDFDVAKILDEETYGSNPRLPIQDVLAGSGSVPYELAHTYLEFDPFKYDVASLGIYLASHYHHIIVDVPLLAPLIARMITPNIEKRFTAAEALAFAQTILPTISTLGDVERKGNPGRYYYTIDLWAGLPQSFVSEWASHRDDLLSWTMRLKNWLFYKTTWGWYITYYYRYTFHFLTYVPRCISRHIPIG